MKEILLDIVLCALAFTLFGSAVINTYNIGELRARSEYLVNATRRNTRLILEMDSRTIALIENMRRVGFGANATLLIGGR